MGLPTVFIRLTGCPLRCGYCDTDYAFTGGTKMAVEDVLEKVASYNPRYVCVTGGEPLAQKEACTLMHQLCNAGYHVSIETSGAISIENIDPRVMIVMDLKTPGSGEVSRNLMSNIPLLRSTDQVKFVLTNRDDYLWAKKTIEEHELNMRCQVLLSPSYEQLQPNILAEWIIADNLPVRFQIQLHKVIWGEKRGV